jgi:ABC-2 type transport system ATP-binding protein
MNNYISINNLSKIYSNKFHALNNINLDIKKGEIFALLGPNGAGKTTLINIICGIVAPTSGKITVNNFDIISNYKKARSMIGIVPQELTVEAFETVFDNVSYSRGLYGKSSNPQYIESLLKQLSLWDKKSNRLRELSGGMKRRILIAKALSHEPKILFLDEPTASVDVELRKDMWEIVKKLKSKGVTIILTTHYIEEAEEIADRVGIINKGKIILVDKKNELINKMGQKKLIIDLQSSIKSLPILLKNFNLELNNEGNKIIYTYDKKNENTGITSLLQTLRDEGIKLKDINTEQSSLENIFINLVKGSNDELARH